MLFFRFNKIFHMILSKDDLSFYFKEDMRINLGYEMKPVLFHRIRYFWGILMGIDSYMAVRYLRSLRRLEYAINCPAKNKICSKIKYGLRMVTFCRLSYKYSIRIKPNTVGYGLYLPHISGGG